MARRGPAPRRILVLGSGAREHALAWRLAADPGVEQVLVAPGNAGMADVAGLRPEVAAGDPVAIVGLAREEGVELVVVGPETPLVAGLADALGAAGVPVFGPTAAAARLEGSKAFTREVAEAVGVPIAEGAVFEKVAPALDHAAGLGGAVVVKADGLAAGKGVIVCDDLAGAERALRDALEARVFGSAGARVVVEQRLEGREASVIALCDGRGTAVALPPARDHKRLEDGDRGPNTGGMGAYSPVPDLGDEELEAILERVHRPVLAELARRGTPFRGALYAGLMLTAEGPRLLEFNVRLGDPEAQVLLPRLATSLAPLLAAAARDELAQALAEAGLTGSALPVTPEAAVAVVLAAAGYPGLVRSGDPIAGLEAARETGALVFTAGVAADGRGGLLTNGGRVLSVVGRGPDLAAAAGAAYGGADRIAFAGRHLRRDVGRGAPMTAGSRP